LYRINGYDSPRLDEQWNTVDIGIDPDFLSAFYGFIVPKIIPFSTGL